MHELEHDDTVMTGDVALLGRYPSRQKHHTCESHDAGHAAHHAPFYDIVIRLR